MTASFDAFRQILTHTVRGAIMTALAVTATACAGSAGTPTSPSAAASTDLSATAKTGADGGPGQAGVTYDGFWYQDPPVRTQLGNGFTQEIWAQVQIKVKGTSLSGEARRFMVQYDANGVALAPPLDLGSPGKVGGSVTATGLSLAITRLAETKINLSLTLALSADGQRLTSVGPANNVIGLSALRR